MPSWSMGVETIARARTGVVVQTGQDRDQTEDRARSAGLALRVAAAALDASALLLLAPARRTLRIVGRHGLDPAIDTKPIVDRLAAVLRRAASGAAGPPGRIVNLLDLPQPFVTAAAVLLGTGEGPPDLGVLLVLGERTEEGRSPARTALLIDTGEVVARVVVAGARVARSAPVDETTRALTDAIEALPEAIAIFDADDRFLVWNRHFEAINARDNVDLRVGRRFEDHLRLCLKRGHIASATGREEAWLAERLAQFAACEGAHELQLNDGRWVRAQDRRLPHGGKVAIRADISDPVRREQTLRLLFESNPAPMLLVDRETHAILAMNEAAVVFYGHPRERFLTLTLADIRPESFAGEIDGLMARLDDPALGEVPRVHRTASGEPRVVTVNARAFDYGGRATVLAAIFDMTDQHRMAEEVRRTRAFLKDVVDSLPVTVFVKDMWDEGRYILYNRAGEALVGRSSAAIVGRTDHEVFAPGEAERFVAQDETALRVGPGGIVADETIEGPAGQRWIRTRKVSLIDRDADRPRYVLGICEDITDQRMSEARIAHMAHHDALTGLPNRFLLHDRIGAALARHAETAGQLAILCLDLDGFKSVNDAWGHAVGDDLLRAVAERLRGAVRACDTVARLGGDEFVILQAPIAQAGEAAWLAGRLVSILARPYDIRGHAVRIGASIGVAMPSRAGEDGASLLGTADAALYEAKRTGRNRFCFAGIIPNGLVDGGLVRPATA